MGAGSDHHDRCVPGHIYLGRIRKVLIRSAESPIGFGRYFSPICRGMHGGPRRTSLLHHHNQAWFAYHRCSAAYLHSGVGRGMTDFRSMLAESQDAVTGAAARSHSVPDGRLR